MNYFLNYAGKTDKDKEIASELKQAGIKVHECELLRDSGEVKTSILGSLGKWGFRRAWSYWIADGPGIPPNYAEELHKNFGKVVRVDGHCGCPSPKEWLSGFAVGLYHVDSQEGLNALARTIRQIMEAE